MKLDNKRKDNRDIIIRTKLYINKNKEIKE